MGSANRRRFHRISFDGQASLDFINGRLECCQVKNLSLTGMCVAGNFQLSNVKNCFVKIFHSEKSGDNCLNAFARVVWKGDDEVGLQFTGMTLENYELLQATLAKKADKPILVLREFPHRYPFDVAMPH